MYRRRRNAKVGLHVRLRGGTAVNLGVVVDERQVLSLFFCVTRHRLLLRARLRSVINHPQGMLHSIAHKDRRGSPSLFHLRSP
jgi:hypothetical protein